MQVKLIKVKIRVNVKVKIQAKVNIFKHICRIRICFLIVNCLHEIENLYIVEWGGVAVG